MTAALGAALAVTLALLALAPSGRPSARRLPGTPARGSHPPRPAVRRRARSSARSSEQAALAIELLAAALAGGSPLPSALPLVGEAVGGDVGAALSRTAAHLGLGASVAEAANELAVDAPPLAPLGRLLHRSAESGAPLASSLRRLAEDARSELRWAAEARARRVGTLSALPVTLCFLPAFVLVGIVPVVVGLGQQLLRS